MQKLIFKPIDLVENANLTVKFRTDAFTCSFKNLEKRWDGEHGKHAQEYLKWLEAKLKNDPDSAVHVWLNEKIVGQVELGASQFDPAIGYVYLYYLIPELRGTTFSSDLHNYALSYLRRKYKLARLCVSKTNLRAINFYTRLGWYSVGDRPNDPEVLMMELEI